MGKISTEEKKRYQVVSRILGILMRIANVFTWIGVGGVVVAAIAVSIIAPNVKINADAKEVTFFDKTSSYQIDGQTFEFSDDDVAVKLENNVLKVNNKGSELVTITLSPDDVKELEKFIEVDVPKILAVLPFVLIMVVVLLGAYALALGHGAKILKNIATEDTPFTKDNIERTEKSFRYMIAGLIVTFAINLTLAIATNLTQSANAGAASLTTVLGLYVLIYIFKAGYQLDEKNQK